jgi:tripartite-type tricarboxylate transporter receptor subunit TctC
MEPSEARIGRRSALAFGAAALAAPALAQGKFPDRPIRFLIPWPPGGSLDALHRQMSRSWASDLGQSVVLRTGRARAAPRRRSS